jgi:enterochelin esterase-like enzyme
MESRRVLIFFLVVVLLGPVLPIQAQDELPCSPDTGTVITQQIHSEAIGQTKSYNLYLPPNWCKLDDLPLLVMLHGLYGDNTDWVDKGYLDDAATMLISAGEIAPLIILMPDGDDSFYVNGSEGGYETYIISELIGAVDQNFATAATRDTRFIGGLSMGGYGALYLGLRHPDMFSAIGAHSPALLGPSGDPTSQYLYGQRGELFAERDIISLIERDGWPDNMRLFVDIGNTDGLIGGVLRLADALYRDGHLTDFQGHVWPGIHDWSYWSAHAPDYLRFYMGTE